MYQNSYYARRQQCESAYFINLLFYPPWKDADPADIVLLPNVTTGNSTVVKSVVKQFLPGNSIYTLNLAYGTLLECHKYSCILHLL